MIKNNSTFKNNPERVIVMGAGGFIGSSLVKTLKTKKIPFLPLCSKDLNLLEIDSSFRLANILNPTDTLVIISAIAPCKNNEMLIKNISMIKSVCEAIEKNPPKHIIYLSSDAVYADSSSPLTEDSSAEPSSLHGVMHLSREVMIKQVCSSPLAIFRPSLIYGANDTHNGYGPNRFIRLALDGKKITLFGKGEEQRDHVFIEDLVNIIILAILYYSEGIINVATGTVLSFREIAQIISGYFNPSIKINNIPRQGPMPHNGYRPFNPKYCLKAFPEFNYTKFDNGLEKTLKEIKKIKKNIF